MLPANAKTHPAHENYRLTPEGRVYSRSPYHGRDWTLLETSCRPDGYRQVAVHDRGKPTNKFVHRLVLETFVGPAPEGQECRHLNGDKSDNRLVNLAWGTRQENIDDLGRHGTRARGERHGRRKLTWQQVQEMRVFAEMGKSCRDIAEMYGNVSLANLQVILRGTTWATGY